MTGVAVDEGTALKNPVVWACVRVISETIASLPLFVYRRLPGGGKEKMTDHPFHRLLHIQPNRDMTAFQWREAMMSHILTWGNHYSYLEWARNNTLLNIWPLRPDRMRIESSGNDLLYIYRPLTSKEQEIFTPDEILHIPGLGYNGVSGYSVITMAREAIGVSMAAEELSARFFSNDATPPTILKHPQRLSEDVHKRLKKSWQEAHGGLGNRWKPAILEEGMDIATVGVPYRDAQFLETRKFQTAEICRFYRVPPHMIQDLDRATFCLPAGTEILTTSGPMAIENIKPGAEIWSRDQDQSRWIKSKITHMGCTGEDPILTIKTTNRTLRANAKHRILVRRKINTPRPGHGGYQVVNWIDDYIPAGELRVGDTLICADRLPESGNRQSITRQVSPNFMEFCGLLLGDGNVYPHWGVSIARGVAAPYMDHYRSVITSEFKRYDGGNGRGDQTVVALAAVTLQESHLQTKFSSVIAARELERLGFTGNAYTKTVPSWVFGLTEELRLAFLRGFLDADGSVDFKGRISYSSCNQKMLSQIRHLCISCGIPVTNLRCQKGETKLPGGKYKKYSQWMFTCSDPGSNLRMGSNDPRYIERMKNGKPFGRKGRKYPRHGGRGFENSGVTLSRVQSITIGDSEPVYDLTVENTHNFVADGIVVHNSNIEQQSLDFVVNTIRPWLVRLEQAFLTKLFGYDAQKTFYVEHVIDGLLRGDIASRYNAYAIGRQWGWLSADDIRELENMNPLPEKQGKVYLAPLNMVPADKFEEIAAQQAKPKEAEPQPQTVKKEEPEENDKDKEELEEENRKLKVKINLVKTEGFQRIFRDAAERVIRREVSGIRRALKQKDLEHFEVSMDEFYRDLPEFIVTTLHPCLCSYALFVDSSANQTNCLDGYIRDHIQESKDEISKWAGLYLHDSSSEFRRDTESIEDRIHYWIDKRPEIESNNIINFFNKSG